MNILPSNAIFVMLGLKHTTTDYHNHSAHNIIYSTLTMHCRMMASIFKLKFLV